MKKLFYLCVAVLALRWTSHTVSAYQERRQIFQDWDCKRANAECHLRRAVGTYQGDVLVGAYSNHYMDPAQKQARLLQIGQLRMEAIQVLRGKPGPLTSEETERLNDYSGLFSMIAR